VALIARNLDTGVIVADKVVVASTRAERAVGLLSRNSLDPGEALWIVPSRGVHTWGMRFAIDILALDDRGVVVDQVAGLRPWRIRLPRPGTAGVLELPIGTLDASGTALGHRIELVQSSRQAAKAHETAAPSEARGWQAMGVGPHRNVREGDQQ
jgi:uncharacterized membrane protein (UPF0127 family)